MPKVLEEKGFKFVIWPNDHRPAHVHARKAGGEAVIHIGDEKTPPSVRELRGMGRKDAVKALKIVAKRQELLSRKWRSIHG